MSYGELLRIERMSRFHRTSTTPPDQSHKLKTGQVKVDPGAEVRLDVLENGSEST